MNIGYIDFEIAARTMVESWLHDSLKLQHETIWCDIGIDFISVFVINYPYVPTTELFLTTSTMLFRQWPQIKIINTLLLLWWQYLIPLVMLLFSSIGRLKEPKRIPDTTRKLDDRGFGVSGPKARNSLPNELRRKKAQYVSSLNKQT